MPTADERILTWLRWRLDVDGHSLAFVMRDGVATFQRTGPAALVVFDNANRVGTCPAY